MMENMVVDTLPKVRLVRCPKCCNLLPEPPGVPIYSCGGCGTFLQAKTKKTSNAGRTRVDEQGLPNANESRREENEVAAPEEETVSNEADSKTVEHQSAVAAAAAAVVDRDESSCGEKSKAIQEDESCSSQSVNLESGSNSAKENGCCSNQSLHIEDTAAMGNISVPNSEPKVEEEEEKSRNFEPRVEEEEKSRNFEPQVEEKEEKNGNFEAQVEEKEEKNGNFEAQVEEEEKNRNFEPHVEEVEEEESRNFEAEPQVEEEEKIGNFESQVVEAEEKDRNLEPQVEEEQNRNFDDEVEATEAGNVVSDQIVAASNVSTSDSVITEQEESQNNGSAEESAQEAIFQEAASSFAVEEQFQNLDTYVGVRNQESKAGAINESKSQPTRRARDEQLELLRSAEEIFFISEEEKKLREELLLLNHQTQDEDSVSEMLMIKGLNTHPTRHRTRSEIYDQWGPRFGEGPSNQEREKILYSSSLHSEQDKTEVLRIMVLQLEEQVRRMRLSGHSTSQIETASSEMNRFYSGTLNRPRNRFNQPYFSPSSGFSSPQQPRRYYPPSSPSWDFETKSVDQLSNNSKFSYQQRERVHIPKRHVRAVAGGSPVVSCYRCSVVLQLPEDFLLSKRKRFHWLKCGSCSTVLKFSLQNGTHIVPYREGGGPEENGKRETEEARRKRSSALHKLMGYSSVTQLVIGSGESSPSD